MSTQPLSDPSEAPAATPFPAPCHALQVAAPLRWLRLGWADITRAPRLSLTYGFVLALISGLIGSLTWRYGTLALYLGLATGFVFVGPILAVGLYSISRQLEAGLKPFMGYCIQEGWHHVRGLMVLGLVLLIVLLVWARAAAMVHIFVPVDANPTWQELVPFLGIGSVVGLIFASIVFAISAFSLPMIMDRKVDPITAVVSSVNAVLSNKGAMSVWVSLIGLTVLIGFATAFLSFIVMLPLIGHATWHAYRETIDASAWARNAPGEA